MYYNIYFSPTGGTRRTADILANAISTDITQVDVTAEHSPRSFSAEDVCLFAVPSFGGRVPAAAIERIRAMHGQDTKAVLLCVYGNRAYEDTLLELKDALCEQGFLPVAAAAAIAEHSIMRQYAKGRPDAQDKAELLAFAEHIRKAL
ncbi:MAG: flavodoxin family protein, partial [Clostridia bacterium]|nr:flavodoxin family protein [Clostridia bacterium]